MPQTRDQYLELMDDAIARSRKAGGWPASGHEATIALAYATAAASADNVALASHDPAVR